MTHRPILAASIAMLLSACGGGGGDDSAPNVPLPVAPSEDAPSAFEPVPSTPDSTPPAVSDLPPIVDVPAVVDAPPASTPRAGRLADLYGRFSLNWSFDGPTINAFSLATTFGPDDLTTLPGGGLALGAPDAESFFSIAPNPIERGAPLPVYCVPLEADAEFLCTTVIGTTTSLFVFGTPSVSGVRGSFEACTEEVAIEDCVEDLILSPDGNVTARVDPSITSSPPATTAGADFSAYLAYDDQGVPARLARKLDAATARRIEAITDALTGL